MGTLFDLCASRKNLEDEAIFISNPKDIEFCKKFQNACVTNATLPSDLRVPPKKYGLDWIIKENKLVLQRRSTMENQKCEFLILTAPNDVGYSRSHRGEVFSGKKLPSGFEVPPSRNGREWILDSEVVILK